jgi:prepilin-type N-terminal cleavage/methylation domain-containing protein
MTAKAFTLIELLVVVLIIGVLAAIALPQYQKAVRRARASEAITMLSAIITAQEEYFLIHSEYTNNIEDLSVTVPEGKLSANMSSQDKKKNYVYFCNHKRECYATMNNPDFPIFGFHTSNAGDATYRGKRWCLVNDDKNEKAREVCELMGRPDPDMPDNFYILK